MSSAPSEEIIQDTPQELNDSQQLPEPVEQKEEELNQSVQEESKEVEESPAKPKQSEEKKPATQEKKVAEVVEKKPATQEKKVALKKDAVVAEKEEKEPTALVERTKFRLKKMLKKSKKLEDMEFKDFFFWENPIWSGIVFVALQGTLLLLSSGYSVLSVLCAVFLIQLGQSTLFLILEKMGKKSEHLPQVIHIQTETIKQYLSNFENQLIKAVQAYVDLLTFANPQNTAIAAIAALFIGYFFSCVSGLFLLGLVNVSVFLGPLSWKLFDKEIVKCKDIAQEKIQKLLGKSLEKLSTYASKAIEKIPKAKDTPKKKKVKKL